MADQGTEGLFSPFLRSQRFRAARPYIKGRVLDVGCGTGVLAGIVAADLYVGVDIDEQSLSIANKQYPQYNFQSFLPPEESKFDTVVAIGIIEHVPKPGVFLSELAKRLNEEPDSFIVCTTPHPVVEWVHAAGAKLRLFSWHADEEHKHFLNKAMLVQAASEADLKLSVYRRFLLGANQLAIFQKK
jgi:2-polyprenyl-3-methyl-5-hydroxy-6-metoxy-1,4-benzoquinol methylase